MVSRTSPPPPVARLTITPSAAAPLQLNLGESDLTISADGRRVCYLSLRMDPDGIRTSAGQLVMRPLDGFEGRSLTDVGRFPSGPFTSPDGLWVAMQTTTGAGSAPVLAKTPPDDQHLTLRHRATTRDCLPSARVVMSKPTCR